MDIGKRIIGNQPFPTLMGVDVVSAEPAKVVAKLVVRPDLCTAGHIMHGGAIMAFADALGAAGAVLNMPREANTTTIESKTNFMSAAREGSTVTGESTPLHVGKRTHVWVTRITPEDGKLVAVVTQTQMILLPEKG
ncbi:MAG: PaaI family thioesterase [Alphaproteobacteria bacterium]|nr:PaaI family thioesterase [Alphaproteobacteria bacterium]